MPSAQHLPAALAALVAAGLAWTVPWLTPGHAVVGALSAGASVRCWQAALARSGARRVALHALAGGIACGLVPWMGLGFRSLVLPCLAGHAVGLLAARRGLGAIGAGALAAWVGAQTVAGIYAIAFFLFPTALTTSPPWHLIRPAPDLSMWTMPRFSNYWSLRTERSPTWSHRSLHVRIYDRGGELLGSAWPSLYGLAGRWHGPRLAWTRDDQLQIWWYLEDDEAVERWTRTCEIDRRDDLIFIDCADMLLEREPLPALVAAHRGVWRALRYGR